MGEPHPFRSPCSCDIDDERLGEGLISYRFCCFLLIRSSDLSEHCHRLCIWILFVKRQDIAAGGTQHWLRSDMNDGADPHACLFDRPGYGSGLPSTSGDHANRAGHKDPPGKIRRSAKPAHHGNSRAHDANRAWTEKTDIIFFCIGHHLEDIVKRNSFNRHHDEFDPSIDRLKDCIFQPGSGHKGHTGIDPALGFDRLRNRIIDRYS